MLRRAKMDQQEEERRERAMLNTMSGNINNLTQRFREEQQQEQASAKQLALDALDELCDGPSAYTLSTTFELPEMEEMMLRMKCRECNRFPSPDKRYLCPAGHFLCLSCGADRGKDHDFKCLVPNDVGNEDVDGIGGNNGSTLCQNTLAVYNCDPIYTTYWHHAIWKCPNADKGCNIGPIKGINFYTHKCSLKEDDVQQTKLAVPESLDQAPKGQHHLLADYPDFCFVDMLSGADDPFKMMRTEKMDHQEEERREKDKFKMISESNSTERSRERKQEQQATAKMVALEALEKIRDGPSAYTLSTKLYGVPENMKEMMLRMTCRECNRFPSPDKRYICPSGHLLCLSCGTDRGKDHDFKCLVPNDVRKEDAAGIQGQTLCQNILAVYPCDPIYATFWHNAIWQCPNANKGCNNTPFKGIYSYTHKCCKMD